MIAEKHFVDFTGKMSNADVAKLLKVTRPLAFYSRSVVLPVPCVHPQRRCLYWSEQVY